MKKKYFNAYFSFLLVFIILFLGCRKNEVEYKEITTTFNIEKFFAGTETADPATKRVVDYFKIKHSQNPRFLPSLVNKCGYPVWDKTLQYHPQISSARNTNEGSQDSVIHVPFVQQNTTVVNSFVEALLNDSIQIDLFEKYKYKALPKGAINATGLTAEKYLNQFFFLQKRVFNHHFFKIIDSTLFKSLLPNNTTATAKVKFINVESATTGGTQINSSDPNCFSYSYTYTTYGANANGDYGIIHHTAWRIVCFPSVSSFIMGDGPSIGSMNGFSWNNFDFGGGGGGGGSAGGGSTGGTPTGTGTGPYDPNAPVGFIDGEELFTLLNQVKNFLPNLSPNEEGFLLDHPNQMRQIVHYLNANNNQEAKGKAKLHIEKMIRDPHYHNIVITHTSTTMNITVWWDDIAWLSVQSNRDLLFDENNPFHLIEFPVDIPDDPVIENGITISPVDPNLPSVGTFPVGNTVPRSNTEDLTYGTIGDETGIDAFMAGCQNSVLHYHMEDLFDKCTILGLRSTANSFRETFKTNTTNAHVVTDSTLNLAVSNSSDFQNFVKEFGKSFNKSLHAKQGVLIANVPPNSGLHFPLNLPFRPIFNGLRNRFNGLQILINDTEYTTVDLDAYTVDALGNWNANITVTIYDHFGLDKADALKYQDKHIGFAAWWLLQHKRNFVPFQTKVVVKTQISGNWHFPF